MTGNSVKRSKVDIIIVAVLICSGIYTNSAFAQQVNTVFAQQSGTPAGIQNFVIPERGCNWSGVGGQVFDKQGNPITGLVVKIWGILEGGSILLYSVTGGSQQIGPGGFLVELADHPISSNGSLYLQILDITGVEISAPLQLNTFGDCARNLLLVNIKEQQFQNGLYFPAIRRESLNNSCPITSGAFFTHLNFGRKVCIFVIIFDAQRFLCRRSCCYQYQSNHDCGENTPGARSSNHERLQEC